MARVLIAGCGYVGTALGRRLAKDGHRVWGLRRNPGHLPKEIRPFEADLTNPDSMFLMPSELDTVFYTAGAPAFTADAYRATYVDGLRNLLAALQVQRQSPKRVFYTSTTGVYAQQDGSWVDEDSPTEPDHFSGLTVLEGERVLASGPFPGVAVRLGGIYGPGRTSLIGQVRDGRAWREDGATRYLNLIHVEDIVRALMRLMRLERPKPVYIGVDSDPQDRNALLSWLAAELGVSEPPLVSEPPSRRPYRNRRCSNARLIASGFVFKYPSCRDGYRELIQAVTN